jgi:HK97 family phage portal protein
LKVIDSALAWFGRRIQAATQRDKTGWFVDWAQGGQSTLSGTRVSNDSALTIATVFACIRAISEDIGKLPLKLYKSLKPRGKEPVPDHRVYRLLHDSPNPEMTAITFRRVLTAHALGWGNGFAEIERGIDGSPLALWPLKPNRTRVLRLEDNRIWYEFRTDDDKVAWLRDDNVLHIHGLGFDGLVGYNVIRYARECLGAALATQKEASAFFGNGIRSAGILTHPGNLSETARKNLRASFDQYQGPENAHRMMLIEEGMKYEKSTIPPQEAQFLETRQFSVPEVCRWFRMPPNKVADTTRAQGWSTLEQTNTDYVIDTLMPWMVCWEQEIWRKLLNPREQRKGLFARHVVQGLLRGDAKARNEAYKIAREWGWMNADDIRELEDLNPLPEDKGQTYLVPMNFKEALAPGEEEEVIVETKPPAEEVFGAMILDAADRITTAELREISKVANKAQQNREKFNAWVKKFFGKHSQYIRQTLAPLDNACRDYTGVEFYIEPAVEKLTLEAIEIFTQDDPKEVLKVWDKKRRKDIFTLIHGGLNHATAKTKTQ